MEEYVICECARLEDSLFLCSPVQLSNAELEAVYIGPCGVYAIVEEDTEASPASIRSFLRTFLGSPNVELYLRGKGRYNPSSGETEAPMGEEDLQAAIRAHTLGTSFFVWDDEMLERLTEKLRYEDARNRGVYRDKEGNWFIARNGKFLPLSDKDPDRIFRLTLFGGILGAHRFALGKWFTGLLYLLTGGLIGLGWFLDLIQIAAGAMKDKKKRLLAKPGKLAFPWYLAGFAASFVIFCVYGVATGILSGTMNQLTQHAVRNVDAEQANSLMSFLQGMLGR